MYEEIKKLKYYCDKLHIPNKLIDHLDGYILRLDCNTDFAQHRGIYQADNGYVEPCGFNRKLDYTPIDINQAKQLLRNYKVRNNIK